MFEITLKHHQLPATHGQWGIFVAKRDVNSVSGVFAVE
jgi:hypothetical protein